MSIGRRQLLIGLGVGIGAALAGSTFAKLSNEKSSSTTATSTKNPNDYTAEAQKTPETKVNQKSSLRFAAIADTGTGDWGQYAVADAMTAYFKQKPFPLVILAGDNIYNDGEIEKVKAVFEEPYAALLKQGVKFRAILGNHDIRTNNGDDEINYKSFNMPSRYYTFRQKSVQFFGIDTNVNSPWQAQLAWLEKSLAESDAPWKIVFGHHPIYSSGHYGSNEAFIRDLTPIFVKHNVQLYLCGHDHDYERTNPINGTTYIVHGGGSHTRSVGRLAETAYSASKRSFVVFEVKDDQITAEAVDTKGQIIDKAVIELKSRAKVG
jgi:3',5'-cyclic AMP phosphodiesterase CpdA